MDSKYTWVRILIQTYHHNKTLFVIDSCKISIIIIASTTRFGQISNPSRLFLNLFQRFMFLVGHFANSAFSPDVHMIRFHAHGYDFDFCFWKLLWRHTVLWFCKHAWSICDIAVLEFALQYCTPSVPFNIHHYFISHNHYRY